MKKGLYGALSFVLRQPLLQKTALMGGMMVDNGYVYLLLSSRLGISDLLGVERCRKRVILFNPRSIDSDTSVDIINELVLFRH